MGSCTLRAAINSANADASKGTIQFAIPGHGVQRIQPVDTPLPQLKYPVNIDAKIQPGYSESPLIVLDGALIEYKENIGETGLFLSGGDSEVQGMSIVNFPDYGVWIDGPGNTSVFASYLGVYADGATTVRNGYSGIIIFDSPNNHVGGATIQSGNVLSGNMGGGVFLWGLKATGNTVENNLIGQNESATLGAPNDYAGIQFTKDATTNTVRRNIISGNNGDGVFITQRATRNTIGGVSPQEANIIVSNQSSGIFIADLGTDLNRIWSNSTVSVA